MGISRYLGDAFSIPNLFRNGGLDFQDDVNPFPAFYTVAGATKDAPILENSWSHVFGETPASPGAPFNYFRLSLPQPDPISLTQDFNSANATFDSELPVTSGTSELEPYNYRSLEPNLLYQGDFSLSFAIRVPQGEVSLGIAYQTADAEGLADPQYMELDALFSSSSWHRYAGVVPVGTAKLVAIGVQVQRRGSAQAVEAHVGNIMLAAGAYDGLPYTGDPAAQAFPRGAIVMSLGLRCPPGFVEVSPDETYPREGEPGQTGGSLKHEHELVQTMYPKSSWPRRSLLDSGDATGIPGLNEWDESRGDTAVAHEHPIIDDSGEDNTEPNYRGYLLCKRV